MNTALARTVIYARQSRDMRGAMAAVTRQIDLSMRLIQQRGLGEVLDPLVDNDVSAYSGKHRPGYEQLLKLIESGTVDTVVAYHLDRLLRSLTELEQLITLCEQTGVKIVTVVGDLDLSTDMGRLVGRILASVARGEVERKSRRQRDEAEQAAAAGKAPSRGAFAHPRVRRVDGERVPVPPEQIEAEREAMRGSYADLFAGASLVRIAKTLNKAGFRTAHGGEWTRSAVRAMLLNPRNAGLRYLNGERVGPGQWEAVVSEETWQAAVHLLTDPARRKNHGTARRWPGAGIYLCGQCLDSDMRVNYHDDGERVYRCRATGHNSRSAQAIDLYVMGAVAARLRRPEVVVALRPSSGSDARAAGLRAEAAGLNERLGALGTHFARGDLTAEQVRAATAEINRSLTEVNDRLAAIGRRGALVRVIAAPDPGVAFLEGVSLEVQRSVIQAVCEAVVILPNPRRRWAATQDTVLIRWKGAHYPLTMAEQVRQAAERAGAGHVRLGPPRTRGAVPSQDEVAELRAAPDMAAWCAVAWRMVERGVTRAAIGRVQGLTDGGVGARLRRFPRVAPVAPDTSER